MGSGRVLEHPEGPASNLKERENYPVVQVAWDDAVAYAKWASAPSGWMDSCAEMMRLGEWVSKRSKR